MKIIHKLLMCLTLMMTLMSSLHCQENVEVNAEDESPAYYETVRAAHWSAYVPIGALITAAVFLGFADTKHESHSSHSSWFDSYMWTPTYGPWGSSSCSTSNSTSCGHY